MVTIDINGLNKEVQEELNEVFSNIHNHMISSIENAGTREDIKIYGKKIDCLIDNEIYEVPITEYQHEGMKKAKNLNVICDKR